MLDAAGFVDAVVEVGDVQRLGYESESFDAVFSHAVIDYLVDPLIALQEFRRVLKPGGVIGLRSPNNDFSVIGPYDELLDESLTLFRRATESLGGSVCRGRLLGAMLKNAGFERIFARPSYERPRSAEEFGRFCRAVGAVLDGRVTEIAIREGWIDETRRADILSAWKRFSKDPSNCFALAWCEALAYKPA